MSELPGCSAVFTDYRRGQWSVSCLIGGCDWCQRGGGTADERTVRAAYRAHYGRAHKDSGPATGAAPEPKGTTHEKEPH